jgi:hypothetical protein
VALGWGLWEGPARFYFLGQLLQRLNSPSITKLAFDRIDFRRKWLNIRHGKANFGSLARMKQQGHQ